ncbi:MAG: 3-deoxy-D-manno-octulosonic acid transferase [Comamonadaceae bacterium]|nr:3-deoxy-D-manno-octulosonic acid transferase [Comamonadaceae bacterium]
MPYNTLLTLAQPLLRRKLARRAQAEPLYGDLVPERFGHYGFPPIPHNARNARPLWIHAVSLGETRTAGLLIEALRARIPDLPLLLTHGTATGRAEGQRLLREGDLQCWYPWDTRAAVGRFLAHFQPRLGLLMETEVWPNMVAQCRRQGLPLWLVNARLNARSHARIRRARWLMGPAYRHLAAVLAQTEADAQRLRDIGAPVTAITGNIKFDARPDAAQRQLGHAWRERHLQAGGQPIAMLASSREGEEAAWLAALPPALLQQVQWLIVPRHPQRFDAVEHLLQQRGLRVVRRSAWGEQGPVAGPGKNPAAPPAIWLGDSMGEMALYYSLAHAALLGGSFAPLGGQNLIEACACACPVVMGPHTFNFAQAADDALAYQAALRAGDIAQAITQTAALLHHRSQLHAMQNHALAFAQSHRGALDRLAGAVASAWQAQTQASTAAL